MVRSKLLSGGVALALFTAAPSARAAEGVSIWYRAGDGCPSAAAFLARLSPHTVTATIARAGDRIDFVVTLDRDERGSSGSLERQSSEGTVAIRQVEAASCEAVADALALTLALSADPDASTVAPVPPPPKPEGESATEIATKAAPPAKAVSGSASPPPPASSPPEASSEPSPFRPSLGAHASIGTLVEGSALLGASAFVDVALDRGPRPSARLGFVAGFAAPGDTLHVELLLGRLEACPLTLGRDLSFVPCVALDLGALRARNDAAGGRTDTGFWSAAWLLARAAYAPSAAWAIELEGGVSAPLAHYELASNDPGQVLAKTERIAFGLAAGARVAWP